MVPKIVPVPLRPEETYSPTLLDISPPENDIVAPPRMIHMPCARCGVTHNLAPNSQQNVVCKFWG